MVEVTLKKATEDRKGLLTMKALPKWLGQSLYANSSIIVFLVLWEIAPRIGWVEQTFISPPSVVLETLRELLADGTLLKHIGVSLGRALGGFGIAAVAGIPLGFFLGGGVKLFERVATPLLRLLNAVNPFSLFPVFILLFGIGEVSKVAMIIWVCVWPVLLHTITGVKEIDPLLLKSAQSMGVKGKELFYKVILPAAAPAIFHGLKMSSGVAFFMLIAAEMIGASSGLGWLVWNAQTNYQIPVLFAATVVISVLGLSLHYLFGKLENKVINWKEHTPEY
ncbi:putative membrane protein [Propionispora sp. 2/2-37]|nr:putative membrane protein [Propionispora sp. 2/2-37]